MDVSDSVSQSTCESVPTAEVKANSSFGFTVNVMVEVSAGQFPGLFSALSVNIMEPSPASAGPIV